MQRNKERTDNGSTTNNLFVPYDNLSVKDRARMVIVMKMTTMMTREKQVVEL